MDISPESLREIAQYLRNSARLFPNPRTRKAFEWLLIKVEEIDDHASAWEADRNRFRALRKMYQEHMRMEDVEVDTNLDDYISAQEASEDE